MTSSSPAVKAQGLRKVFGDKVAVHDLTLIVERGEVFGFLGPNGAGKTTSVKMLLSLISPTAGSAQILNASLDNPDIRSKVGFLPEHFRFHDWLTGEEFLYLHADLYHMSRDAATIRIAELLELVGLTKHKDKKIQEYSKGMLQRIGLAQAMLNRPELIFLDEPTSGLDPVGRRLVRDIIRDLREAGTTVFLNSHMLSEVEITCDRVALRPEIIDGLSRWSANIRADDEHLSLTLDGEADLPEITRYLVEQGVDLYSIRPNTISLEDLFIQIVGTDGGL
jgi:ABC-2 type transport system ATP-binding protein